VVGFGRRRQTAAARRWTRALTATCVRRYVPFPQQPSSRQLTGRAHILTSGLGWRPLDPVSQERTSTLERILHGIHRGIFESLQSLAAGSVPLASVATLPAAVERNGFAQPCERGLGHSCYSPRCSPYATPRCIAGIVSLTALANVSSIRPSALRVCRARGVVEVKCKPRLIPSCFLTIGGGSGRLCRRWRCSPWRARRTQRLSWSCPCASWRARR